MPAPKTGPRERQGVVDHRHAQSVVKISLIAQINHVLQRVDCIAVPGLPLFFIFTCDFWEVLRFSGMVMFTSLHIFCLRFADCLQFSLKQPGELLAGDYGCIYLTTKHIIHSLVVFYQKIVFPFELILNITFLTRSFTQLFPFVMINYQSLFILL